MLDMDIACLKIGTFSELVGVSASTLRRWEEADMLPPAAKDGQTRLYSPSQVGVVLENKAEWMADKSRPTGKLLEGQLSKAFREFEKREPLYFYRFPDTYMAGDFLPAQPGDFEVLYRGIPVLIEAKESAKYRSLAAGFTALVEDHQMTSHRLWDRAGGKCLIIFGQVVSGEIKFYEAWDGEYCSLMRRQGNVLRTSEGRIRTANSLKGLLKNLPEHFPDLGEPK